MKYQLLLILLCMLSSLSAQAEEPARLWMPDIIESAVIVGMAGHAGSYAQPGRGHKLMGFTSCQPADVKDRTGWRGIRFDNNQGEMVNGVRNNGSLAIMTDAPLILHKITRKTHGKQIECIEWRAETKRISGISPIPEVHVSRSSVPQPPPDLAEPVISRSLTRVTIHPHGEGQKYGKMWIIFEDDMHHGIMYAMELKCILRPEFFEKRLSE